MRPHARRQPHAPRQRVPQPNSRPGGRDALRGPGRCFRQDEDAPAAPAPGARYWLAFQMSVQSFQSPPSSFQMTTYLPVIVWDGAPLVLSA